MDNNKKEAIDLLNQLYERNRISSSDYSTIYDALTDIELLRDRDEALEKLWLQLEDIPVSPDTECIEAPYLGWGVGISRDEIWRWFDQRHSKGVAYLLYHGAEDYVPETKRLYGLKKLCFACDCCKCRFNHDGECRYALVHEQKPQPHDPVPCMEDHGYRDPNFAP